MCQIGAFWRRTDDQLVVIVNALSGSIAICFSCKCSVFLLASGQYGFEVLERAMLAVTAVMNDTCTGLGDYWQFNLVFSFSSCAKGGLLVGSMCCG